MRGRRTPLLDGEVARQVARVLPAVRKGAFVDVVARVDVFHLLPEGFVVGVAAEGVAEDEVQRPSLVTQRVEPRALQFGLRVAHDHLVLGVVLEGVFAVFVDEDFLSRGGVDAGRTHGVDVVLRAAFPEAQFQRVVLFELIGGVLQLVADLLDAVLDVRTVDDARPRPVLVADHLPRHREVVTYVLVLAEVHDDVL